ncbi:hypothetical protein TNCV_3095811 [Trichonephila clavipes]|nr:hypothetical protein TNCV_3095811 [Trichonephila clavipes]
MAYSDFEKAEAFKDTLEVTFQENEEPYCDDKIEEVENLVNHFFDNFATSTHPLTSPSEGSFESVQEFAARINKLGIQIFQSSNSGLTTAARNANDQLLQSRFISGLRNDIRRFVLAQDPNTLEESINAALIKEQTLKLNEIASNERSGLSSLPTESPIISALTDRLQELNLRVQRLQKATTVIARETSKGESHRKVNVFKFFYCGLEGHRQAECRKRIADQRSWNSPFPFSKKCEG